METINQVMRHLRNLFEGGDVQNIVALAYGVDGVSAGMYGRYDRDVAAHLWRRISALESQRGYDGRAQEPLDFRSVPADEYREIRARARFPS